MATMVTGLVLASALMVSPTSPALIQRPTSTAAPLQVRPHQEEAGAYLIEWLMAHVGPGDAACPQQEETGAFFIEWLMAHGGGGE